MSQITTHVLDTGLGRPAAGVPVRLLHLAADCEEVLATARTDDDGRAGDLGPEQVELGTYRLLFDIAAYAAATGQACFFPEAAFTFTVRDESHHHVPLLLSPFAYSTYRGS
jgi:5-hydroxyisourate hydrolase